MYNTPGHVCPETGRRAITLDEFAKLPPETEAYRYSAAMAEWGYEPWRLVLGVSNLRPGGCRVLTYASGIQIHMPSGQLVYTK
jgi:hypothetical protein